MNRLRLLDCRSSRLPRVMGLCATDIVQIAQAVNTAQGRLLFCSEAADEGWYGTFAEILFYVEQSNPYITLPRDIARLETVNVCQSPMVVNNQFVEYLQFGNGRMPKCRTSCGQPLQGYSRNNAVTFTDLTTPPQLITVFISNPADVGKRILIQGPDQNDVQVYSHDGLQQSRGLWMTMELPFSQSSLSFNRIDGIQKEQTMGQVQIYQTDPTTGAQVLLLTMEPGELTASYRRYYFNPLPSSCCSTTDSRIPVTAIAKMDLIPVQADSDYLLIQNLEAIILECQSARLSEVDNESAQQMSLKFHRDAVRLLNGQITHQYGSKTPALEFCPFGSPDLDQRVGAMI